MVWKQLPLRCCGIHPLALFWRRGEYRKAKLKIEQTELQQLSKQVLLQTKLRQYFNEWRQLREQILTTAGGEIVCDLTTWWGGQVFNGESSLFLVDTRELKTLEAEQKLIELQGKEQKAVATALWAAGSLIRE